MIMLGRRLGNLDDFQGRSKLWTEWQEKLRKFFSLQLFTETEYGGRTTRFIPTQHEIFIASTDTPTAE